MSVVSRDEAGFSLIELLVAILLLGIVGGLVVASVVQALQVTTETTERTNALTDIERGLERVSRQIRAADPLRIDPDGSCDAVGMTGETCQDEVLSRRLDADAYFDGTRREYAFYLVPTGDDVELRQDVTYIDIDTDPETEVGASVGEFIADIGNLETGAPLFTFQTLDPETGVLKDVDCDDLDVNECRTRHSTASAVQITLQKLLSDGEVVSATTAVNIRNTRFEP